MGYKILLGNSRQLQNQVSPPSPCLRFPTWILLTDYIFISGVARIPSDLLFAKDNRTATAFKVFSVAQGPWQVVFSQAMVRATLLGVKNVTSLTDCTKVLPAQVLTVPKKSAAKPSGKSTKNRRAWRWRA